MFQFIVFLLLVFYALYTGQSPLFLILGFALGVFLSTQHQEEKPDNDSCDYYKYSSCHLGHGEPPKGPCHGPDPNDD